MGSFLPKKMTLLDALVSLVKADRHDREKYIYLETQPLGLPPRQK